MEKTIDSQDKKAKDIEAAKLKNKGTDCCEKDNEKSDSSCCCSSDGEKNKIKNQNETKK